MKLHDQLNAYLDNELSFADRVEIEKALDQSPELREELEALRVLKSGFNPLVNTEAPTGKQELLARLRQAESQPKTRVGWGTMPKFAWGMGAILALFSVAILQEFRPAPTTSISTSEVASMPPASSAPAMGQAPVPTDAKALSTESMGAASREMASSDQAVASSPAPGLPLPPSVPQRGKIVGRDIIRSGSLQIEVQDVRAAMTSASDLVNSLGGFVVSSQSSANEGQVPTGTLEVRIPAGKFEQAVRQLSESGRVLNESIAAQDVTAEIAAGEGRVRALADAEQTYLRMLQQAKTTAAQIEIRRRLDEVRAEREALRAETARLQDLAAMSSLMITFTQKARVEENQPNATWWDDSWQGASNTLDAVGRVVGRVAIYALFLSPIWLTALAWLAWNRRKQR